MVRKIQFIFFLFLSLIMLWGCASKYKERGIEDSQRPITGSPMTSDWIEYNNKVEKETLPRLVYLSTSLEFKQKSPKYLTDNFLLDDVKVVIYTKWKTVNASDELKLNIIDPRGRLFQSWKSKAKKPSNTWWWWYNFYVKNAPASNLPGKWYVQIYMNDRFVTKKGFVIGESDKSYEKHTLEKDSPSIMVTPFLHEGKRHGTYGFSIPILIAQNLRIKYPEFRIIDPYQVSEALASPPKYEKPSDYIKKALVSELTHSLVKKYNVKMTITGYYKNPGKYDQRVKYNIFIIDNDSRKIKKEIKCFIIPRSGKNRDTFKVEGSNKIYNTINEEGISEIKEILSKR